VHDSFSYWVNNDAAFDGKVQPTSWWYVHGKPVVCPFFVIWHGTGKRRQKDRAHGGNEGWSLLLVVLREYYGRNVLKW
jgi:hypothetical protein